MPRRPPLACFLGATLVATCVTPESRAQPAVSLRPPHHVRAAAAKLAPALAREVDARIQQASPASVDDALRFSLEATAARLHFGLDHRTTLAFGAKEREGNCIEYSHLFAAIFNRAVAAIATKARACVIHSDDARLFGAKLGGRGLGEHDWVLVIVDGGPSPRRLLVNPTLYDFGLGWDLSGRVTSDAALGERRAVLEIAFDTRWAVRARLRAMSGAPAFVRSTLAAARASLPVSIADFPWLWDTRKRPRRRVWARAPACQRPRS